MTETAAPARTFTDGQYVTYVGRTGRGQYDNIPGTVVDAELMGTRHPGWVYTIRRADGQNAYAAQGIITAAGPAPAAKPPADRLVTGAKVKYNQHTRMARGGGVHVTTTWGTIDGTYGDQYIVKARWGGRRTREAARDIIEVSDAWPAR
jgi:hypothetical protein